MMWARLPYHWYRSSLTWLTFLLLPFSWLFHCCVTIRAWLYRYHLLRTYHFPVPVLVIGNITVGGTGKTPLVIAVANFLQAQGYKPGIVSRGIGGKKHTVPYFVTQLDAAAEVGDEALLLVRSTTCPLVLSVNRVAAVQALLAKHACDVIISDDGLQHYRLGRAIDIAVVDGLRRMGNQCLLPAGPLRESSVRLQHVDFVVVNEGNAQDAVVMQLKPARLIAVADAKRQMPILNFSDKKIFAIAGIGNPQKFFMQLEQLGFMLTTRFFPDHYLYQEKDLSFAHDAPLFMTEKDAVKCHAFAQKNWWYVEPEIEITPTFMQQLLIKLKDNSPCLKK